MMFSFGRNISHRIALTTEVSCNLEKRFLVALLEFTKYIRNEHLGAVDSSLSNKDEISGKLILTK
uniref:Uncharacterized protein n=1 Tax=Rhizophagus irregularis (strain DAOM 181602 / DAOM 197198 / MUCL 43194) TaxID=747089 RepID=U9U529_RHIID